MKIAKRNLDVYIKHGLVECSNRLEEFSSDVDSIKITALGEYVLNVLSSNFAYIDLILVDCGLFNEELASYISKSANKELSLKSQNKIYDRMVLRMERAEKFLDYLEQQEREEFESLNLGSNEMFFSDKMKKNFLDDRERILQSAKKNQ